MAAAWSGGRGREEPRERSPRRRGGDARPAHAPHPVTTASGTPPPPQRLFPPPHTHHARHTPLGLTPPRLSSREDARGPPPPEGGQTPVTTEHAQEGGGRVRTPRRTQPGPRHRTLLATIPGDSPSHPRHRPPEEGGEEHSLLWALLPPRARNQAGHGQPAKPGLVNDPSAGSPTETLLRLLLPLDSQVRPSSQRSARAVGRPRRGRSEGLTKPSNR